MTLHVILLSYFVNTLKHSILYAYINSNYFLSRLKINKNYEQVNLGSVKILNIFINMLDILYVLRGYSTGYYNLISFKYLLVLHLFAPPPQKKIKKIPPPTPSEHLFTYQTRVHFKRQISHKCIYM